MKLKALFSLLMLAGVATVSPGLKAQTQLYTLTNGTVQWHEKEGATDVLTSIGYHEGTPRYQTSGDDVTFKVERGNRYLSLDTNATNIVAVSVPTELSIWKRSGDVGYYWQDWGGYRYYLMGSPEDLRVEKVPVGQLVNTTTYWYSWDFGAGIDKSYVRDGQYQTVRYWMAYDGTSWVMSCDAEQRPETIVWLSSDPSVNNKKWYCSNASLSSPACSAVVAMPVTLTEHPIDIENHTSNVGLKDIALSSNTLVYPNSITAGPEYFPTVAGSHTVRPAYKEYTLETARDGISLLESGRTTDGYGSAGVATTETKYVHSGSNSFSANLPATTSMALQPSDVVSWEYGISNAAKRYVSLSVSNTGQATLRCLAPPVEDMVVDVTLTVTTSQGIKESVTKQITLSSYLERAVLTESENSVFVGGSVFGGGRMADVDGNTDVTVNACDTISYVFGGNDIGGRVDGASTVLIGTDVTSSAQGISIGSVYGAGNGYYHYPNRSAGANQPITTCSQYADAQNISTWDGSEVVAENTASDLHLPTIQRTTVIVNSNFAKIDTVFGGARNANIGYSTVASDTSTSVRIHKGIIFAVFGGNNVGGCLPENTFSGLYITGDSLGLTEPVPIINSYWTKYGRNFGIRYVFGGGNRVFHRSAIRMEITGGMIDSVFAGGNSADVYRTICHVNCAIGGDRIYENPTAIDDNADQWVGTRGRYNIRALFGGNNLASMAILPDLKLESGGIGVVYGGGNAGDMVYDDTAYTANIVDPTFRQHLYNSLSHFTGDATTYIQKPAGPVSTYVHLMANDSISIDYVYGGCRSANVLNSTLVDIDGGYVGAVFGGCNIAGDVGSTVGGHGRGMAGTYVVINSGKILNNVYGGANGYYHCAEGEQESAAKYVSGINFTDNEGVEFDAFDEHIGLYRPTHNYTHLLINGGTIYGNTYAGGNHAAVGFYKNTFKRVSGGVEETQPCEQLAGGVHFAITGGTVKGNVFGGANMAQIYGLSYVHAMGDAVIEGALYGGNDRLGKVMPSRPFYSVLHDNAYDMEASDGTLLNTSTDASATSKYATYIKIEGTPTINEVYGGGNGAYNYDGEHTEYPDLEVVCTHDGDLVLPIEESTFIDVHVSNGGHINTVFGGGNAVGVEKDVMVLINAADADADAVGTVFGGNNMANMETCVPEVNLKKGVVGTVFGGSNMGHMKAYKELTDACGNPVPGVSSYVYINSTEITVTGYIFGGCNKADVLGKAFVDIRNTSDDGIDTVFGGNDVSGFVRGNTRVDLVGGAVGTIYGGSNGYYDYVQVDHDDYAVYKFNHAGEAQHLLYPNSVGSPTVAETRVHVYGGTIKNNVYGGGRMGDCNVTNVIIDDKACGDRFATIRGRVYGGGEGDTSRLDRVHRGNVKDSTHVELHHASDVIAYAYGGGKGGDVYNTHIYSYPTWDESFQKIFGGCWGANVLGTAHMQLDANETFLASNPTKTTADMVFGGNDFSGNVYNTNLIINSGRYGDIYGAGNGDFESSKYLLGGLHSSTYELSAPNSEQVYVCFNDGNVKGTLFGGGRLGTSFRYLKDANGAYVLRNAAAGIEPQKIADTNFTAAYLGTAATGLGQSYVHDPYTDPLKYSYIIVNVHDGLFEEDIFAGAKGQDNQLVYGFKVLNMDGGTINQSIYGGSQSVSDGYSATECDDSQTTLRPSSAVNVTGGNVKNHVFGAGYKGYTHGSVYVNIGTDAVALSTVWDNGYANSADSVYAVFMPNRENSLSDSLVKTDLLLDASVYAGANWGQNDGSYVFTAPGFFGGESRILIDGQGYYQSPAITGPQIEIANAIFGSGTSVLGGDVLSRIDIRNYGVINNCAATKELKSVQRANSLWLHNTAIKYLGTPDASMAYYSQDYSINNVDTVNGVGFNLMEIYAPMDNMEYLRFYENAAYIYDHTDGSNLTLTTPTTINNNPGSDCSADRTVCDMLERINPVDRLYTGMLVHDGISVEVATDAGYGGVMGYAYLLAEEGTKPVVSARTKTGSENTTDGGFSSTCNSDNRVFSGGAWVTGSNGEMVYTNYMNDPVYRYWAPGGGLSTREVVILAHSDLDALGDTNKALTVMGTAKGTGTSTENNFSIAHAKLVLPPSKQGNYYRISMDGIKISDQNDAISLTDVAWRPVNWNTLADGQSVESTGAWYIPNPKLPSTDEDFHYEEEIHANRNDHFGLMMVPLSGFATSASDVYTAPNNARGVYTNGGTVISPSKHINVLSDYYSPRVASNDVKPEMDFYLTYDNDFFSSILGSVKFYLVEYNSSHQRTGDSTEVEVYISTILNEFKDMEYTLVAKYNMGKSNIFTRRSILPPTLVSRDLYVTSVEWFPTEPDPVPSKPLIGVPQFKMSQSEDYVLGDQVDGYRYAIYMKPVKNTAADNTSAVAWNNIAADSTNISSLVFSDTLGHEVTAGDPVNHLPVSLYPYMKVGRLDGRGAAGLNFELFYNGNFVPGYHGYFVGDVVLNMLATQRTDFTSDNNDDPSDNRFKITLHVQVRPGGDTIYVASANSITIGGTTLTANNYTSSDEEKGKRPSKYVQTLEEAMSVHVPGDVICILDTVNITSGEYLLKDPEDEETPIQVIRYDGHHHDAPGEEWVYRGSMIKVSGSGTRFTTYNVDFQGGAVALNDFDHCEPVGHERLQKVGFTHQTADTNVAFGPIIAISNRGEVVLGNHTVVEENYNGYNGSDIARYGAINVTNGGILTFHENVTVRNNLNPPNTTLQDGDGNYYPLTGAVYVNSTNSNNNTYPAVRFKNSTSGTKVTITDNYTYTSGQYWKKVYDQGTSNLIGYEFDTSTVSSNDRRNLFLTRAALNNPDDMTKDAISNYVRIDANNKPNVDTRVGVSKWFPGEELRDTIRIATANNASTANTAYSDGVFTSDEGFKVLHSTAINNTTIYFVRCATFRHQVASTTEPIVGTVYPKDALEYVANPSATCPNGTDKVIYRVQGGFFPYTYSWSGVATQNRTTTGTNTAIMNQVNRGNYNNFILAISDSVYIPTIYMSPTANDTTITLDVSATDAAGCLVNKTVKITITKDPNATEIFQKTGTVAHWIDTNSNVTAEGRRNYPGVKITAYAWPNRDEASISALIHDVSSNTNYVYLDRGNSTYASLSSVRFCEGDTINLAAAEEAINDDCDNMYRFVMWDFNPYMPASTPQSNYVVPATDASVVAYYAPSTYWKDVQGIVHEESTSYYMSNTGADYVTTYNGDVHIYNEKGLAWFINVVNGTNGNVARPFYFNKVYLHQKAGGYNMKCHLWTPVGAPLYPFRGWFQGVGSNYNDTAALPAGQYVVIKNLIVDEPDLTSAGFFGYLDTARISSIKFEGAMIRGSQYVGTLAGQSVDARIKNVVVTSETDDATSTVLTTHNISGGLIGKSTHDRISNYSVAAKFIGDAVYCGGVVGHGTSDTIINGGTMNDTRLSGLYIGGIAGWIDGTAPVSPTLFRSKRPGSFSLLANNYVRFVTNGASARAGGVSGYAKNAVVENNYVFGRVDGASSVGGVGAVLANNASAHHNYYAKADAKQAVGMSMSSASVGDNAAFQGRGNAVTLEERVYGVDNLTRVLNIWVRQQNANGGNYLTWTSDLVNANEGYPYFGEPDIIPVHETITLDGCEEVIWDGVTYTEDQTLTFNIIDSVQMIDSTLSTIIRIHHATSTDLTDTAQMGVDYSGHGFYVSAAESALLHQSLDEAGRATLVLSDTLQGEYGCDSVITLTLTFTSEGIVDVAPTAQIKVYPNPTTDQVKVEADEMSRVEVYDNGGRRLQSLEAYSNPVVTISLGNYASGVYYVRVHSANGVTIQKVIKR